MKKRAGKGRGKKSARASKLVNSRVRGGGKERVHVCTIRVLFSELITGPVYFRRLTAITDFSRTGRLNPRSRWNTMHAIFQQKLKAPEHRGRREPARYYDERTLFPPRLPARE